MTELRVMVARFEPKEEHRTRLREWLHGHASSTQAVRGLAGEALCYEALHVEAGFRTYLPTPALTTIYCLDERADVEALVTSDAFHDWWTEAVMTWTPWVSAQDWVIAMQTVGPTTTPDYEGILLTQVDVSAGHEDAWRSWYENRHMPMALEVPGLFLPELRRFEAIDIKTPRFHCSPSPWSTHLLPIAANADLEAGVRAPEFLALAADTAATWGGALQQAVSTLCRRL
jgi:hypothetical protein